MTPDDLDTMARTIWGEARGEPLEGKIAVAWVIKNRAEDQKQRWPGLWGFRAPGGTYIGAPLETRDGIAGVCRQPWQFSCWNGDDPNRAKLIGVTARDEMFRDCLMVTAGVLSNNLSDPTQGANHYCVKTLDPSWSNDKEPVATIGNHKFYKL